MNTQNHATGTWPNKRFPRMRRGKECLGATAWPGQAPSSMSSSGTLPPQEGRSELPVCVWTPGRGPGQCQPSWDRPRTKQIGSFLEPGGPRRCWFWKQNWKASTGLNGYCRQYYCDLSLLLTLAPELNRQVLVKVLGFQQTPRWYQGTAPQITLGRAVRPKHD